MTLYKYKGFILGTDTLRNAFTSYPRERGTSKYLKRFEFPYSKGCYYFLPEFFDDAFHGNSITNLATLLMLLMKRDYILPIKFINDKNINTTVGTPIIYYVFSNWPVGNLSDKDFDSFVNVQDDELLNYANILAN